MRADDPLAVVDSARPPAGVVVLPDVGDGPGQLDPGAWVEAVRRPVTRRLAQSVAEHVAAARVGGDA